MRGRRYNVIIRSVIVFLVQIIIWTASPTLSFTTTPAAAQRLTKTINNGIIIISTTSSVLNAQKITEKEASSAIDKVVRALQKDKAANEELGRLTKTNNVLGFGSPRDGIIAVRFNASFQRGTTGMGRSAIPLPFGLGGQTNTKQEGRGTMVGQVKANVDANTGKVLEVSVFRDLGYGRAFNLKI
jgi:hypothetical protein